MFRILFLFVLFVSLPLKADRARLLTEGTQALQARVDLVQQAEKEILVEYFSVWEDDISHGFFSLLLDAAKRGVKVKIIVDSIANRMSRASFSTLLEHGKDSSGEQNIEIKLYNPVRINLFKASHRNHSKLLIVDSKLMITGGRNISDKYYDLIDPEDGLYYDLDVLLDGPAVLAAREDFYRVYRSDLLIDAVRFYYMPSYLKAMHCQKATYRERKRCKRRRDALIRRYQRSKKYFSEAKKDLMSEDSRLNIATNTNTTWLENIKHGPEIEYLSHQADKLVSRKSADLTWKLLESMDTVDKELVILTPYLIPLEQFLNTFENLVGRGVRVVVVTNSPMATDNVLAQSGYQKFKDDLIAVGAEIYEYKGPETTHGKAMIFDGQTSYIGTYNLDPRSAFINREVGVFIDDSQNRLFSLDLLNYIEGIVANSILVGKDGRPQNLQEQKELYKQLSGKKRFGYRFFKIFLPFIVNQL